MNPISKCDAEDDKDVVLGENLKQISKYKYEIDTKLKFYTTDLKNQLARNEFDSGFSEFSGMCINFVTEHMKGKSTLTTPYEMTVYPNEFIFLLYKMLIHFFMNIPIKANIHKLLHNTFDLLEKVLCSKQFYLTVNNESNEDIQILLLCYILDFYLLIESNYLDKLMRNRSTGEVEIRKYFKLDMNKEYTNEDINNMVLSHYDKLDTFVNTHIINRMSSIPKSTYKNYRGDTTQSIQNKEDHKDRIKEIISSIVRNKPLPDVPNKNLFKNIEFELLSEHTMPMSMPIVQEKRDSSILYELNQEGRRKNRRSRNRRSGKSRRIVIDFRK